ncbi:MAG: ribosomal RNA small subunit methyltransferase A [Clostridiales bacterium]|nr:ribosomal RNA small subunit methyltransferase A [Clostridiales bacterium]
MEKSLKNLLREHGLVLKKAYGQNFLTDNLLLEEIVSKACVTKDDTVLEIGCGAGALTSVLSKKAKRVVGYEIDTRLKPVLNETLSDCDNVEIVFSDIMKQNLIDVEKKLGGEYIMVANLPYYITTPIIMRFIEEAKHLKAMVIMVQEEVAYRLSAKESTSDYGAITVGINLRGSAEVIIRVPRDKFTPPPNVDSAVVKIDIEKDKNSGVDFKRVRDLVRCAFSSRRKMLVNNIMSTYKMSRAEVEKALNESDISLTVRGENLSAEDYVRLVGNLPLI